MKVVVFHRRCNFLNKDGSYEFGYNNPDSYHYADANRNNVVRGEFGGRNPATGAIDSTIYTAGPRGFRPRGKNVVRKYDLNQNGPRPIGSPDDPYYDPFEDPSYSFAFKTRTYNRQENANRVGDVNGRYSYVDDVGERHNVEYVAGKNTGFHVKTPFPDSNPRAYGPLYFNGRGKPIPRGRTSIQRGLDGSYRFVSAGPDQRRTEASDATGHVRGSYTYLDDKGVQHSVHYIAGPETGYRVLKQVKGPHLPTIFPFGRPDILPPDFYDYGKDSDVFDTAASGHFKPKPGKPGGKDKVPSFNNGVDTDNDDFSFGGKKPAGGTNKPSYTDDDTDDFGDLFGGGGDGGGSNSGGGGSSSTTARPSSSPDRGSYRPGLTSSEDDGSYKPAGQDGSYSPSTSRPKQPTYGTSTTVRPGGLGTSTTPLPQGPTGTGTSTGIDGGYEGGYNREKPSPGFQDGYTSNETPGGFGLFGSESSNARPPYGGTPSVNIGISDASCARCKGTILTNVGDRLFTVPPGVSVRAHVQAIDLLPITSNVPSPSEQYKVDTSLITEQLNESRSNIVKNNTESEEETSTTEATITTILPSTNSTNTQT